MRYVLHPGWVPSVHDGQVHFINAKRLAHLYRVRIEECVVVDSEGYEEMEGDIHLWPRYHGDYALEPR